MRKPKFELNLPEDPLLPGKIRRQTPTSLMPPQNWHENTEFVYCVFGAGYVKINDRVIGMNQGDLVVINSEMFHSVHSLDLVTPMQYLCVTIDRGFCLQSGIATTDLTFCEKIQDEAVAEAFLAIYDAYDTYYDGIVEDGYDVDPYAKWSSESSECYKAWSAASSDIYKCWSAASSTLYQYWSAVSSGFYRDDYDVDAIIAERERERAEAAALAEAAKETETTQETEIAEESDVTEESKITETTATTETASDNSGGIRPEFKEAMDSYEAFFDEYIEFMTEYANADATDLLEMLADYTEYMKQYVETMKEFEDLENEDMTTEEALYYAEVASRISRKLLEVEY